MDNESVVAARLALTIALSKSGCITKLGEHLKKLLAPIDDTPETQDLETPQSIRTKRLVAATLTP